MIYEPINRKILVPISPAFNHIAPARLDVNIFSAQV